MSADGEYVIIILGSRFGFTTYVMTLRTKLFQNMRMGWLTPYIENKDVNLENHRWIFSMQGELENKKQLLNKLNIGEVGEKLTDELHNILWGYRDVFSENKRDLGCADTQHEINTRDHPPIALKQRRIP